MSRPDLDTIEAKTLKAESKGIEEIEARKAQ